MRKAYKSFKKLHDEIKRKSFHYNISNLFLVYITRHQGQVLNNVSIFTLRKLFRAQKFNNIDIIRVQPSEHIMQAHIKKDFFFTILLMKNIEDEESCEWEKILFW